jgi:hypothetical protein
MITRENLDERQGQLLNLLTALFEQRPMLDTRSAAAVYPQLRTDLIAAGATDGDFECLTEHLIGLVIEHGSALSTRETWRTLLDLISTGFACRSCSVLAEMAFSWPSTSPSQSGNTTPLAEAIRGQVRAFTADEC